MGFYGQASQAFGKGLEGLFKLFDFFAERPKLIVITGVAVLILGAIVSARDTWLFLLGISLSFGGMLLRRAGH